MGYPINDECLYHACSNGQIEIYDYLIDRFINGNKKLLSNCLSIASENNNLEIIERLIDKAKITKNTICYLFQHGHYFKYKDVLDTKSKHIRDILKYCVKREQYETIEHLLGKDSSVLSMIDVVIQAILSNKYNMMVYLINKGFKVNEVTVAISCMYPNNPRMLIYFLENRYPINKLCLIPSHNKISLRYDIGYDNIWDIYHKLENKYLETRSMRASTIKALKYMNKHHSNELLIDSNHVYDNYNKLIHWNTLF